MMTTNASTKQIIRLMFVGGDCMLGRAVQLTFPYQSVGEELITDSCTSRHYLELAMHGNAITSHTLKEIQNSNRDGSRLWNDYLKLKFTPPEPAVRLLNLETSVTKSLDRSDIYMVAAKGIHYHMHSDNIPAAFDAFSSTTFTEGQSTSSPYVVVMANNHSLDFGRKALDEETFDAMKRLPGHGHVVGIGETEMKAKEPVHIPFKSSHNGVKVYAFAASCSGTPRIWNSTEKRSGLVWLPAITTLAAVSLALTIIKDIVHRDVHDRNKDLVIISIHWGPNWASLNKGDYSDGREYRAILAHRLIDELGIDILYGHSSHHIRGIELYKGKLIVYGAGDLINDYEGFKNSNEVDYETCGAVYLADVDQETYKLVSLRLLPFYIDNLQLKRVTRQSSYWDPWQYTSEPQPQKLNRLCAFINHLSELDAGPGGIPVHLEILEHGQDAIVPEGSVLAFNT